MKLLKHYSNNSLFKNPPSNFQEIHLKGYQGLIDPAWKEFVHTFLLSLPPVQRSKGDVHKVGDVYVKRFWKTPSERLFGSAARREFQLYEKLKALNIKTPQSLGFLEGKDESLFFSAAIQANCDFILKKWIHEGNLEKIDPFLMQLGIFINDLLDKGLHHGDLKLGNILYEEAFYIIDLFGASIHPFLNTRKRIHSYAQILSSLAEALSSVTFPLDGEYLKKFLYYLDRYQNSKLSKKIWEKMLSKRKRLIHKVTRRLLRNPKEIVRKSEKGVIFQFYPPYAWMVDEWPHFIDPAFFQGQNGVKIENGFFIQKVPPSLRRMGDVFFKNRAQRNWFNAHALRYYPILVPKPCACIYAKESSFLIFEVEKGIVLADFMKERYGAYCENGRRVLIEQLAQWIGKMHFEKGIYPQDLTADSILIQQTEKDHFTFFLLKFERIKYYLEEVPNIERLKNISQLTACVYEHIKMSDAFRFLKIYLSLDPIPPHLKAFFHKILETLPGR